MSSSYRRQLLLKSFQLADLCILVFSFGIATVLLHQQLGTTSFEYFLAIRISIENFILFLGLILIWHLTFSFTGLYHSMRLSSRWSEVIDILKATTLGTIAIFTASILFDIIMISKLFLIVFWGISCVTTILSRILLRVILGQVRARGRNLRRILIAGTNSRVIRLAEKIKNKPQLGYELAGFVDTIWESREDDRLKEEHPFIHLDDLEDYVRDNVVDEVVIGFPMKSQYDRYCRIINLCIEQGINVRILADLFFTQLAKSKTENFEGIPIITLYTGTMNYGALMIKRALDIMLSLALLIVLSPLLLITMLAIKVRSPGPIFFVQERLGLNKRRFNLYKFRTMVQDAEKIQKELETLNEASGPVFKIKNDPRITPVGRFFRKSSIDELPQLLNVLKGDMSLVGPRPLPVRDYMEFDQCWFNRRFSVRPGITCFWQVNGRGNIPFSKWIELDLNYIDHWSLALDLRLLIKTIPAVLRGSGAE